MDTSLNHSQNLSSGVQGLLKKELLTLNSELSRITHFETALYAPTLFTIYPLMLELMLPGSRTIEALQKRVTELESELAQLKCAGMVKTIGIKRKTDPSDCMDVDRAHPAEHVITEASEASVVVPHIGFDLVDAEAHPNPAIDLTLIKYSDFLPGNSLHEVKFTWNPDNGSIIPPDHIHNLLKSNCLPHVCSISGPTAGAQMFPATNAELESLISEAHTSGGWSSLTRLRLSRGLASLLEFLWTRSPDAVSVLTGTARKILSADINPAWARYSTFSDPSQFILPDDSSEKWSETPTDIPSITSKPRDDLSDVEYAHGVMVHYNPSSHLGLITSDTYSCYLPSIHGIRLYTQIAPIATDSDKTFGDTTYLFRTHIVTIAAIYGLYSSIIARDHLTISSEFKLTHCTKVDVKTIGKLCARLAAMGVTTALMDSLYPWALQYCITACSCPDLIKAPICHYYAEVFINAQHCLMFYLLPIPSDTTYGTNNSKYSKDKEISANRHNPFPEDDATTNGVAGMVLDGALTQPSDGDQPIPGPSKA
ncbi:hypothetical protein L218DRAFT_1008610 [Marasmius fiardii PR-910]|nr:hypothetical protein L218DRAFT_1008610 [Marasmius fiardii PR-910]